jgi:Family of unknown function (DUF6788)
MHVGIITHMAKMESPESPEEIRDWFVQAVSKLWPVAEGSLSFRRSPCAREHCSACSRGEGHPAWVLYGKRKGRRVAIYVPGDLVGKVEKAVKNGRLLQELAMEAGERYTKALKSERQAKSQPGMKKGRK